MIPHAEFVLVFVEAWLRLRDRAYLGAVHATATPTELVPSHVEAARMRA